MKIKVKNLTQIFLDENNQEKVIFKDINFSLPENQITLLFGSNGSGKSSLALILATITKPISGKIFYNDLIFSNKAKKKDLKQIRKKVKFLFQNSNLQLFKRTIQEEINFNLISFLEEKKLSKEEIDKKIKKYTEIILKQVNFPTWYLDKSPHTLSSGEKRKLLIACLLISQPDFLIMDEPTIGLDVKTKKNFVNFLENLNKNYNCTILIISHDKKIIQYYNNIIAMDDLINSK